MNRAPFITVEGGEGAGKSTQVRLLVEALRARGLKVLGTREPGGAPGAEAIRELLLHGPDHGWTAMTEALLHFAARREHATHTIDPALSSGIWVVSDRFADSTVAYQGYGMGLGPEPIRALARLVLGGLAPDLTFVLDLPAEAGMERASGRGAADRYERMDPSFHERLREGFLAIAAAEPERCIVVDAEQNADAVHARLMNEVLRRWAMDRDEG